MTSFLSLDSKIGAWSSSFRSTPKQPDEAMRVLEGKAFELDVNLEVVQPLTARQLSFACLYLASANWETTSQSVQNIWLMAPLNDKWSGEENSQQILLFNCFSNLLLPHLNLWFGEVLVKFWSLRGLKTFKMMKIGVVAGENRDQMVAAKRRCYCGRPSPDEASRG
ncbi:unnamed protein product [Brassica oleracea var. botrytis]